MIPGNNREPNMVGCKGQLLFGDRGQAQAGNRKKSPYGNKENLIVDWQMAYFPESARQ